MDDFVIHKPTCKVVAERRELAGMIARAKAGTAVVEHGVTVNLDHLLGAWVEYFGMGDQEAENCDCGAAAAYFARTGGVWTPETARPATEVDLIVSAGHGEYGPTSGPLVTEVWNPHDPELDDVIASELDAHRDPAFLLELLYERMWSEDKRAEAVVAVAGDDLGWNIIVRVQGSRAEVNALLDGLVAEISGGPAGGDDDTFDYWPSGVRYAQALATALGRDAQVAEVVSEAVEASGWEADDLGVVV